MSTDLIHRLRVSAEEWLPTSDHTLRAHKLLAEAADALERLQKESVRSASTDFVLVGYVSQDAIDWLASRKRHKTAHIDTTLSVKPDEALPVALYAARLR